MNDIFSLAEGMGLQNGKYTIVRMLSHGGFGVTYLAHHNLLDVDVCIKEFFPAVWCNRDAFSYEVSVSTTGNVDMVDRFMQKFIKEAQSIARLHHEGIVKFHDVFEENGTAYYVMDFIEGKTLQQLVKERGALPLDEAIGYIRQAAEALGYLHGKRMNHLDVKPANMMIDHSGKLTLIDFGVAKHYGEDGSQTTTTPMCISRGYSPIEQYKDGGVSQFSPAADIYPLGATLYYLLTGTIPPEATELAVDELLIPDTIPTHIAEAIRHAMESKPSRRTPSAAAFLGEIDQKPTGKGRPNKNKRTLIAFGAIILLILIIAGVVICTSGYGNRSSDYKDTASLASQENKIYGHSQANTGDLLAQKNGENFYFTLSEWEEVPDKTDYKKMGVVVNDGSCDAFYVALEDEANGKEMTWDEAVSLFGEDILPSKTQCLAMYRNRNDINKSLRTFSGMGMYVCYWGKERDSSSAWYIRMPGPLINYPIKTDKNRVRAVAPVAESAK